MGYAIPGAPGNNVMEPTKSRKLRPGPYTPGTNLVDAIVEGYGGMGSDSCSRQHQQEVAPARRRLITALQIAVPALIGDHVLAVCTVFGLWFGVETSFTHWLYVFIPPTLLVVLLAGVMHRSTWWPIVSLMAAFFSGVFIMIRAGFVVLGPGSGEDYLNYWLRPHVPDLLQIPLILGICMVMGIALMTGMFALLNHISRLRRVLLIAAKATLLFWLALGWCVLSAACLVGIGRAGYPRGLLFFPEWLRLYVLAAVLVLGFPFALTVTCRMLFEAAHGLEEAPQHD